MEPRPGYLALSVQALIEIGDLRTLERVYDSAKRHFEEIGEALPDTWASFLDHHTSSPQRKHRKT